ncbi:hypothetical protein TNCV_1266391 [Trichonephila clavipes]|nr:hypothetical protein TNCV_1266391 [Trichonephila clavipes]
MFETSIAILKSFHDEDCSARDRIFGIPPLPSLKKEARHLQAEIVEVEIDVVSPSIVPLGNFTELNRTVTCLVLKANDRRTSCPCHDEFRGPRSDYVRQQLMGKVFFLIKNMGAVALGSWAQAGGRGVMSTSLVLLKIHRLEGLMDAKYLPSLKFFPLTWSGSLASGDNSGVALVI